MTLSAEEEKPFLDLKAARAEKVKSRAEEEAASAVVETASKAFDKARAAEAVALKQIGKQIASLKKGEDRFVTTSDGTQWHCEYERGVLHVEQVKETK